MALSSAVDKLMAGFQGTFFKEDFTDKVIVDFACGFGTWGHTIRSMIFQGGDGAYLVGCDVFRPFLVKNKKYNPYDDLVVCDGRYLPFREKCANIVLCFEMIEHMDKGEGLTLLVNLENMAKDKLVLSTPNGFMEQHNPDKIQFEEHKSFWLDKDFERNGFRVLKTGKGLEWEFFMRNFRLINAIDRIELLRSKNKWNGVMLIAEKNLSKVEQSTLDYNERAKLLIK